MVDNLQTNKRKKKEQWKVTTLSNEHHQKLDSIIKRPYYHEETPFSAGISEVSYGLGPLMRVTGSEQRQVNNGDWIFFFRVGDRTVAGASEVVDGWNTVEVLRLR